MKVSKAQIPVLGELHTPLRVKRPGFAQTSKVVLNLIGRIFGQPCQLGSAHQITHRSGASYYLGIFEDPLERPPFP